MTFDPELEGARRANGEFGERQHTAADASLPAVKYPAELDEFAAALENVDHEHWSEAWATASVGRQAWQAAIGRADQSLTSPELDDRVATARHIVETVARRSARKAYRRAIRATWADAKTALHASQADELESGGKAIIVAGAAAQALVLRGIISDRDYETLTAPLRAAGALPRA